MGMTEWEEHGSATIFCRCDQRYFTITFKPFTSAKDAESVVPLMCCHIILYVLFCGTCHIVIVSMFVSSYFVSGST